MPNVSLDRVRGIHMPATTYIELVRSLFEPVSQPLIMIACFGVASAVVLRAVPDPTLATLAALGALASIGRLAVIAAHRDEVLADELSLERACVLENRFAFAYVVFAIILGLWCGRALSTVEPEDDAVVVALLFGYGAGVATSITYRPWIGVPSLVAVSLPSLGVTLGSGDPLHIATGLLLAAFLGGGIHTMLRRYRSASRGISMRILHEGLARHDHLTGLPNRLALREAFDASVARTGRRGLIAVHCLDLDRFKPVNDLYGHTAGDAVLKAVADRLSALLRRDDIAARIGGDEFVVLQTGAAHAGEAEMLARRIARALSQPFDLGEHRVTLGASVGYAMYPDQALDLDRLIAIADEALYEVKHVHARAAPRASGLLSA